MILKVSKPDIFVVITLLAISLFFMVDKDSGERRLYLISEAEKNEIELKEQLLKLDDGDVIIQVTPEGARFIESDCPNKICIKSSWVKECGETAACVPNRYALAIECREAEFDAVSE